MKFDGDSEATSSTTFPPVAVDPSGARQSSMLALGLTQATSRERITRVRFSFRRTRIRMRQERRFLNRGKQAGVGLIGAAGQRITFLEH